MIGSVSGGGNQFMTASLQERQKEMFTRLDSNSDGTIDASELSAVQKQHGKGPSAEELMKEIDTNGDAVIDEEEHNTFIAKMEEKMKAMGPPPMPQGYDQNGDGQITVEAGQHINELI
ncbi:MAG: EF-hand domain-containing protein [Ignavibacteriae bacterium]|nr:EF-hand domain-containing protein [Ignavibacteriota bacterium]